MNVGDRARFFDAGSGWWKTGDVDDNDIYFLPATVVRSYRIPPYDQEVVDLRFDHRPDDVSVGHFAYPRRALRP